MTRIILHIDVNNAFLSWTAVWFLSKGYDKDIRKRYAVIGGDESERKGIVLAKSDLCKRNGVVTAEPIYSARRKCPYLEIYKPSFKVYKFFSDKMFEYLSTYTDIIERYSIDECFLDYTNSVNLFGPPIDVAYKIKDEIYKKFGFTVNVGIGNNKLLAKMASDFEKPNKVHTLFSDEVENKMFPLPIEDLFMIGKSSSKKLREMNINTIGDLARTNEDILIKRFKSMGKMMHNYANGIDDSPVYYEREASKSISSSTVLPYNYSDINKIKQIIMNLSMEIGRKLRDENKYANTIGVWLKYTYFDKISKQKTLDNSISTDEEIYNSALKIFDNLWNYDDSIRSICIFISNFSDVKKRQLSIFDINNSYNKNDDKLQKVIDEIRNKYGNDVIGYGNNNEKR